MFNKNRREVAPFGRVLDDLMENWQSFPAFAAGKSPVAIDIIDRDGSYLFRANIPGIEPQNIDIEVKDNVLTIKGDFSSEAANDTKDGHYILRERQFGSFSRSFTFNEAIVPSECKASFKNGLLEIEVAKEKPIEPETYKIAIN